MSIAELQDRREAVKAKRGELRATMATAGLGLAGAADKERTAALKAFGEADAAVAASHWEESVLSQALAIAREQAAVNEWIERRRRVNTLKLKERKGYSEAEAAATNPVAKLTAKAAREAFDAHVADEERAIGHPPTAGPFARLLKLTEASASQVADYLADSPEWLKLDPLDVAKWPADFIREAARNALAHGQAQAENKSIVNSLAMGEPVETYAVDAPKPARPEMDSLSEPNTRMRKLK